MLFAGIANANIRGPGDVAQAFTDAAAWAIGLSAALSVVALVLVFALPKSVSSGHGPSAPPAD